MDNIKTQDKLAIIFLIAAIALLLTFLFINNKNDHQRIDALKHEVAQNPFENIHLKARAAIVWDMKSEKVIYGQHIDETLPLASLTKVMTALTAADLVPYYTTVTIHKESLAEEGDSGLYVDEKWSLKDLLNMSLITSSNDGVRAVASAAGSAIPIRPDPYTTTTEISLRERFVDEMNKKTRAIGLSKTYFENENGLDKNLTEGGAYGTASDVAIMFDYIMRNNPSLLEATRYPELSITSLTNIPHEVTNTNLIVNSIPGLLASKTGYTDLAGGNLAIVADLGLEGPYVISVLGSTYEERFTDIQKLIRATTEYVKNNK